jgi:hypothetical protein
VTVLAAAGSASSSLADVLKKKTTNIYRYLNFFLHHFLFYFIYFWVGGWVGGGGVGEGGLQFSIVH